jgi:hypothetical protein
MRINLSGSPLRVKRLAGNLLPFCSDARTLAHLHLFSGRPDQASWEEEAAMAQPYLLSSRARDLFSEYRWAFPREMQLPEPGHDPGEQYLAAFDETLGAISGWIGSRG